jgi:hypothetical protein
MRLDMQKQEFKTKEWDIVRQAKEVGIPGMDKVAAVFVKHHVAYLLKSNKYIFHLLFHISQSIGATKQSVLGCSI